ncbi:MAG TPA: 50S ribosomal protein L13 [Candidatus Krumholzibacteriaceae bacterium]|nr:50S ribosomal protein L13 [Candidatus Krumholzibacteriaceae bacterium]
MSERTVIDGDGLILGRLASMVAKRLLAGEAIDIVNAEKIVVSGKRKMIIETEKEFLNVGGFGKGPIHYRQPHRMVRRTIRGMLPRRKSHGRNAYSRLRVHIGVPRELEAAEKESIPEVHSSNLSRRFVTVGEIAEAIGWKK